MPAFASPAVVTPSPAVQAKSHHITSSVSDDSGHPHCLHGRRECGRLSRPCSCLVAGGASCCLCGACVSSLSEQVSPEQSWSPTVQPGVTALNCNSGLFQLHLGCSGGTSPLGVDAGLQGHSLPSSPWFPRLVLSALLRPSYCADSLLWGPVFSSLGGGCGGWGHRCFRRSCGVRCFAGLAGLQTSPRTATRWPRRQPNGQIDDTSCSDNQSDKTPQQTK